MADGAEIPGAAAGDLQSAAAEEGAVRQARQGGFPYEHASSHVRQSRYQDKIMKLQQQRGQ